ncbi:AAEL012512-PA [Aedes aegypti]|uniref:AAEL012512-PA n=1 Tax=Aedes aegypti TaxID=7159 RepID=Q16LW5_AEDAE|nr:AAEL012512-PA [Aedes aegypti]
MDNVQTDAAPFRDDNDRFQCDARFPSYVSFPKRLGTFRDTTWDAVVSRRLAEAGYFYPGRPATIQCFYCGLRVSGVTPNDNPWQIHEKFTKAMCGYIHYMRDSNGTQTCFDKMGRENDWTPCNQLDSCRLCMWELSMITPVKATKLFIGRN